MSGFENGVLLANNVNFNTGLAPPHPGLMTQNGQLIIGSAVLNPGGTHLNIGEITSVGGTIAVTYDSPNINLETTPQGSSVVRIVRQVFLTTGTYTPTTNMSFCDIEVVGGGGGGGGAATGAFQNAAGGGSAGGYARVLFSAATIGASQAVTIGSGGAGGANTGASPGGTGGTTSLGALISATGGDGGHGAKSSGIFPGGGAPGIGTGGDYQTEGAAGLSGSIFVGGVVIGGEGGETFFGGSAVGAVAGTSTSIIGNNGNSAGGGGGGAAVNGAGSSQTGGVGAAGIVIITEYISFAGGGGGGGTIEFTTDIAGPVTPDDGVINVTGTNVFSDGTVAHRLTLNVQAPQNLLLVGTGALTAAAPIPTVGRALLNTDISGVPAWQTSPLVSGTMTALMGYVGIISGTGPMPGIIGELRDLTGGPALAVPNNSAVTLISASLSPGVWDLQGIILYNAGLITGTLFEATISTLGNTRGQVPHAGAVTPTSPTTVSGITVLTPVVRATLTVTTLYNLNAYALDSAGSLTASAYLHAVRVA
ncbi:MAG: hypothetical protein WB562_04615 [Candidatus Sulfotelmatobacter sp.]